ncbi:unnamed protein product [Dicrocoelium dendriticum]|nr:unnamed protein product [Dicrocoelium dendriticum]
MLNIQAIVLLYICALNVQGLFRNELNFTGYLIKAGEKMNWSDSLTWNNYQEAAEIVTHICKRLTLLVEAAANRPLSNMDCKLIRLHGDPIGNYVNLTFEGNDENDAKQIIEGVISKLAEYPKLDESSRQQATNEFRKRVVVRFGVTFQKINGFSYWRSAFSSAGQLTQTASVVCMRRKFRSSASRFMRNGQPNCAVTRPPNSGLWGDFSVQFPSRKRIKLNEVKRLLTTPVTANSTYDIAKVQVKYHVICQRRTPAV